MIDDDGGDAAAFDSSDLSRAEGVELSGAVRRILHAVGAERVLSDGDAAYAHTLLQMGFAPGATRQNPPVGRWVGESMGTSSGGVIHGVARSVLEKVD